MEQYFAFHNQRDYTFFGDCRYAGISFGDRNLYVPDQYRCHRRKLHHKRSFLFRIVGNDGKRYYPPSERGYGTNWRRRKLD